MHHSLVKDKLFKSKKLDNSSIYRNIDIMIKFFFLEKSQIEKLIKYAFLSTIIEYIQKYEK
jgi:hypothetical protein